MTFDHTRRACYAGYITQAIVNNLAPLLFIVFQRDLGISLEQLGGLALLNFSVQIATDLVAVKYVDRMGYRRPLVAAHVMAVAGLLMLAILPQVLPSPFVAVCVAIAIYAIGGGLLEVLVSPVAEALPSPPEGKAAAMSLLHSFYCWGQVIVVVGTTLLLGVTGPGGWYWLPVVWALVPLVNGVIFLKVPMPDIVPDHERTPLRGLFVKPVFFLILMLMLAAGASELTMSQWSSFFAEKGLGVSKVWGDLAGSCLFAVFMGASRMWYGLWGERIPLVPVMAGCGVMGAGCYVLAAAAPHPALSLAGCALCGVSVSLLWPGTYSLAAARFPAGGAAMFGLLAVAGDMGCALGPWFSGEIAHASLESRGILKSVARLLPRDGDSGLRTGILAGVIFPMMVVIGAVVWWRQGQRLKTG